MRGLFAGGGSMIFGSACSGIAAIGNSMIVPELRWIGRRIEMVEALMAARQVAA